MRTASPTTNVEYDGAAHHVEVRAGVGAADHRARIAPHVDAHLPRLGRLRAAEVGAQAGAQLVGDHDVEERVERRLALFLGDVADVAALERLGLAA